MTSFRFTKKTFNRLLSLLVAINLVLVTVLAVDISQPDTAYAASKTSSVMGSDSWVDSKIVAGNTVNFAGYTWMIAEVNDNYAVLQDTEGIIEGYWPGYVISKFGGANKAYAGDIAGQDLSAYNGISSCLYDTIKDFEYTKASYGSGLYMNTSMSGNYYNVYYNATKPSDKYAVWLSRGDSDGEANAYSARSTFSTQYVEQGATSLRSLLAFNLSKDYYTITQLTGTNAISATSARQYINEGASINLSNIISSVTYVGGESAGKSAEYTVTCNLGTINGTTYTAPTDIVSDTTEKFTIKTAEGLGWRTEVVMTIKPAAPGRVTVSQTRSLPELHEGDKINLSNYFRVDAKDALGNTDYTWCDFTISSPVFASVNGTTATLIDNVSSSKAAKIYTVTFTATSPSDYASKTATAQISVYPTNSTYTNRDAYEDAEGYHTYTDPDTNITWKFKYDDNGNIRYLYTPDNPEAIIKDGTLIVPQSIAGVPVIGIGGGYDETKTAMPIAEDEQTHSSIPFIPTYTDNANASWTNIYIPSSIKYINDEAFKNSKAIAKVTIPDTVSDIGTMAFYGSGIYSLVLNTGENELNIKTQAFSNTSNLAAVSIQGSKAVIGLNAFANTAIESINIPNGTTFNGKVGQNNSYAFNNNANLQTVIIDTDTVYSNIFTGETNLAKVVFGSNVQKVNYDWAGTSGDAKTVARTTYVLSPNTEFEIQSSAPYSPFGYAGALKVYGPSNSVSTFTADNGTTCSAVFYVINSGSSIAQIKTKAKGQASSISFEAQAESDLYSALNTSSVQTGIEAYSATTILTGKTVDKEKIKVYSLYNTDRHDQYDADGFYAIRTSDATTLLSTDMSGKTADEIRALFAAEDTVTAYSEDSDAGVLGLTIVVLRTDDTGAIKLNNSNYVDAFTAELTMPVKPYTEEDDFFATYGSYATVINAIADLKTEILTLTGQLEEKTQQCAALETSNTALKAEKDSLKLKVTEKTQQCTALETSNAALKAEKDSLKLEITDLTKQLDDATKSLKNMVEEYSKLLGATKIDKSDYTYTVTVDGVEKTYVLINNEEVEYSKDSAEEILIGEETVYVYETADGRKFYAADDGIHIVTIEDSTVTSDTLASTDSDSVAVMQRKISVELQNLKDELASLNEKLAKLESGLGDIADSLSDYIEDYSKADFETLSDDEKINTIKTALREVLDGYSALNTDYTSIMKTIYGDDADVSKNTVADAVESIETLQGTSKEICAKIDSVLQGTEVSEDDARTLSVLLDSIEEINTSLSEKSAILADIKDVISVTNDSDVLAKIVEMKNTILTYQSGGDGTISSTVATNLASAISGATSTKGTVSVNALDSATIGEAVVSEKSNNGTVVAAADVDVTGSSASSIPVTFSISGVDADDAVTVLHKNSTTGEWETLTETHTDGTVTATFTSFSPVVILKKEAAAVKVDKLTSENESLKKQLETAKANSGTTYHTTKVDSSAVEPLTKEVDSLTTKVTDLSTKNATLTSENTTLTEANKTLTTENEALKGKVSALEAKQSTQAANQQTTVSTTPSTTPSVQSNSNTGTGTVKAASTGTSTKKSTSSKSSGSITKPSGNGENSGSSNNSSTGAGTSTAESIYMPSGQKSTVLSKFTLTSLPEASADTTPDICSFSAFDLARIYTKQLVTNCQSTGESTADQKESANSILSYYAGHLDELFKGTTLADYLDDTFHVNITGLTSFDAVGTDAQNAAISSGETIDIDASFNGIEDGYYIVVHESTTRGEYDVLLLNVTDGSDLVFELQDLSPISIAKIDFVEAEGYIHGDSTTVLATAIPSTTKTSTILFKVLGVMLMIVLVLIVLYILKRKNIFSIKKYMEKIRN